MESKSAKRSVLPHAASLSGQHESNEPSPLVIELSVAARENLAKLQLKFLDREGRQPDASQVIEELINTAAGREPDAPYPSD